MNRSLLTKGIAAGIITLSIGCAHNDKKTYAEYSETSSIQKTIDSDAVRKNPYIVISFPKGSSMLSSANKMKIEKLTNAAKSQGKIDDIKVLAWADKEYPVGEDNKAAKSDIQLAANRAESVETYLEDVLNTDAGVEKHNMAKKPMLLSKYLKTDDYKIKTSIETDNDTTKDLLDNRSSQAVVLVDYEE